MIKNCEEVLDALKAVYNNIVYSASSYIEVDAVDKEDIRKVLVDAGVKFNKQTGDAI